MTEDDAAQFKALVEATRHERTATRKAAIEWLVSAGMITPNGILTQEYGGEANPPQPHSTGQEPA